MAQCFAWRHYEAFVQKAHDAIRRCTGAVELEPADQCLISQRDEVGVVANLLVVISGDKIAVLGELHHSANDAGRRDVVEIALHLGPAIRQGYSRSPRGCRRRQIGLDCCRLFLGSGLLLRANLFGRWRLAFRGFSGHVWGSWLLAASSPISWSA
jgi:hypothetical protein